MFHRLILLSALIAIAGCAAGRISFPDGKPTAESINAGKTTYRMQIEYGSPYITE